MMSFFKKNKYCKLVIKHKKANQKGPSTEHIIQKQQVKLNILAKPNAKKTAFLGIDAQALLISLHAKPHKGAANKELIRFLADFFTST